MIEKEKRYTKNNYFDYRQVGQGFYNKAELPLWIKNELNSEGDLILDYGCGFGQNIRALEQQNYKNVYGVDIEKSALDYCKKNMLKVKELNLEDLKNPFENKFDVIILTHIIEHIPKDEIISTLSLIREDFLKSGGSLLIAVPNAQSNTDCYWAYEDWTHYTLFTSGSIYYVLRAAGFEKIDFLDTDGTLGSKGLKKLIKIFLLKLYKLNKFFWNKVTSSSYHQPSPQIFSFEIKVKAS